MNNYTQEITLLQSRLYQQFGRTDAHYKEYYGVLFVLEGAELIAPNVVLAVSEFELEVVRMQNAMTGGF